MTKMRKCGAGHGIRTRDIQLGKLGANYETSANTSGSVADDEPTVPLLDRHWTSRGGKKGGSPRRLGQTLYWPVLS